MHYLAFNSSTPRPVGACQLSAAADTAVCVCVVHTVLWCSSIEDGGGSACIQYANISTTRNVVHCRCRRFFLPLFQDIDTIQYRKALLFSVSLSIYIYTYILTSSIIYHSFIISSRTWFRYFLQPNARNANH